MSQLQVDATTGEMTRTNGQLQRITGEEEIAQHVRIRFRLFRGEVPMDLSKGMQFVEVIFKKGSTEIAIDGEFRSVALETPGVVAVESMEIDLDTATRVLDVEWSGKIDVDELRDLIPVADEFTVAT